MKEAGEEYHWYIRGTCWIRCDIVSNFLGMAVVTLRTTGETVNGRARRGLYGVLVDAV